MAMRFRGTWVGVCFWGAVTLLLAGCGSVEPEQDSGSSGQVSGRSGEWTQLPDAPLSARHEADGVWVDGRFVVMGGWSSPSCPPNADCAPPAESALRDGASFDPATKRWTPIADAPVPVAGLNGVVAGGRVYLLTPEQERADSPTSFLSYDPGSDTWTKHPLPPTWGALVAAGSAVVAVPESDENGATTDAAFDIKTNKWQRLPDDPLGPSFDRSAVWTDGGLLLAAKDLVPNPGADGPALVRLARLDDGFSRWSTLPDSEIIGWGPMAVQDRVVWPGTGSADGGGVGNWGRDYFEGGIFEPASGQWQALPRAPWKPALGAYPVVAGSRALVAGHLLDPATGRWTRVPKLPGEQRAAATVIASPDLLLFWGGSTIGERPANFDTGYLLHLD
jgi:hypothetical protein